ncbi:MAG: topoisomerase DNA-binding C4 zinc finger domain-containing protein [Candidatus Hydromicrobium sp.]
MIKTIKKHQTEIISDDIRDKIYTYLNTLNITDRNLRKKHVHNINEKKNERKNKISNNICPRCGGSLIIRNSKYGSFKGCSNYPKCKFSFDIKK